MLLLTRIQEVREKVNLLESELLKGEYSWENIKTAFERTLPIISTEAIENFKACLDAKAIVAIEKRKTGYGRRKMPDSVPSPLDMTAHVIDYLTTCSNMTASKTDIYKVVKTKYPQEVQAIPHRSKGKDTQMSALEYRLEWACTILTKNKKAVGRNQDPKLPKKHIKLISKTPFTKEEIDYLNKNRNSLSGYVKGANV
jgi:uncharacterized protein YfkK (UPF0435 family)